MEESERGQRYDDLEQDSTLAVVLSGGPNCGDDHDLRVPVGNVSPSIDMPEWRAGADGKRYVNVYVKHDIRGGAVIYRYAGRREDFEPLS